MESLVESIRAALAAGATSEQKTTGAQACRTILTALEAEVGKPILVANAPKPSPLTNVDPGQALDLLIARLSASLPKEREAAVATSEVARPRDRGLRIEFVSPPPRTARRPSKKR